MSALLRGALQRFDFGRLRPQASAPWVVDPWRAVPFFHFMALYDRSYMREDPHKRAFSPLVWLLIITTGIYLLQSILSLFSGAGSFLVRFFALRGDLILDGYLWTPLTYAFLHDVSSPFHLIFNMLLVFFIGRTVQEDLGGERFLGLYLIGALGGALSYLIFNFNGYPLVGASAAALGLLTVFCLMHADEKMTFLLFFVIPVSIKPRFLLWGLLALEVLLLFPELRGESRVSASAHLGGMAGGFWFFKSLMHHEALFDPQRWRFTWKSRAGRPTRSKTDPFVTTSSDLPRPRYRVNLSNRQHLRNELDRILDKINDEGFGALSVEEKRTLDRAKDIFNR
jgi:membrane associated rhomboid family serine protease